MKLVSLKTPSVVGALGFVIGDKTYDANEVANALGANNVPGSMKEFLEGNDLVRGALIDVVKKVQNGVGAVSEVKDPQLMSPVPFPRSCRDGYAFRQHVEASRRNRGLDMIPEFDQFPVFYLMNHQAVFGPGDIVCEKDHFLKLDFELEWAAVIGKPGRNINASQADDHIIGYMILNDISARQLQLEEMKLNMGPAKGKDFANAFGPWLVTVDELEGNRISSDVGNRYDLEMTAFHNGIQISIGNTKDMAWTFAQIIERASYGIDLFPGDVIGSGTVGSGCYYELNGTGRRKAEAEGGTYDETWLKPGDKVTLSVDHLGSLTNRLVLSENNYSLLDLKK